MPDTDAIWNRALEAEHNGATLETGDLALRDALLFHSYLMNGGMAHALEVAGGPAVDAAAAGLRYLGLTEAAGSVDEATRIVGASVLALASDEERQAAFLELCEAQHEELEDLGGRYEDHADDEVIEARFLTRLGEAPGDFAELE